MLTDCQKGGNSIYGQGHSGWLLYFARITSISPETNIIITFVMMSTNTKNVWHSCWIVPDWTKKMLGGCLRCEQNVLRPGPGSSSLACPGSLQRCFCFLVRHCACGVLATDHNLVQRANISFIAGNWNSGCSRAVLTGRSHSLTMLLVIFVSSSLLVRLRCLKENIQRR